MQKLTLTAILIISTIASFGQAFVDTLYFNSNWEETNYKDYSYYRILTKDTDGLFLCKDYLKSGELQMTGKFTTIETDNREGEFKWFDKKGVQIKTVTYKNNKVIGLSHFNDLQKKISFKFIIDTDSLDNAYEFNEVIKDFRNHISKNLRYPKNALDNKIQGTVYANFYVDSKGKLSYFSIAKSANKELDLEAERVIKSFYKWPIPKYKGENIYYQIYIPVAFVLIED